MKRFDRPVRRTATSARPTSAPWLADAADPVARSACSRSRSARRAAPRASSSRSPAAPAPRGRVAAVAPRPAPVTRAVSSRGHRGLVMVGQRLAGSSVLDATFWALTLGTIVAARRVRARHASARSGSCSSAAGRAAPRWQIVVADPRAGARASTRSTRTSSASSRRTSCFRCIVLRWLLIGVAISFGPGLAARARRALALESADCHDPRRGRAARAASSATSTATPASVRSPPSARRVERAPTSSCCRSSSPRATSSSRARRPGRVGDPAGRPRLRRVGG